MNERQLREKIVAAMGAKVMTSHDLAEKIGVDRDKVVKLLAKQRGWPLDLELYQWRDNIGQRHYQLVPPNDMGHLPRNLAPKAYRYLRAKEPTPYIRVFIPDNVLDVDGKAAEHIELVFFSDVHMGHKMCDVGAFNRDVKEVGRRPNRFAALNGDNIENSLGNSAGGLAWSEQRVNPKVQRHQMTDTLRAIAHMLVAATPGNHEDRSMLSLMNPLEEIASDLGIPYFDGPYNMEIIWRGCRWTFHVMHGNGNASTAGGKLNSAGRPRTFNDVRHFFVSGHVHHQTTGKNIRLVRRRKHYPEREFWYEEVKEYIVICPAYLDYEDTYAYRWGLPPGSRNTVTIQLYANGDYHVLASKRASGQEGYKILSEQFVDDTFDNNG